jgi:signal transduction histidine kinase
MLAHRGVEAARDHLRALFADPQLDGAEHLNPLREVEVLMPTDVGRMESRFLRFAFRRVRDDGAILVVTVIDVTERVLLARELESATANDGARDDRLLDLALALARLDAASAQVRLAHWQTLLDTATLAMQGVQAPGASPAPSLDRAIESLRALEADAAAPSLQAVARRAALIAVELGELRARADLSRHSLLPSILHLDEFRGQLDALSRAMARLPAQPGRPQSAGKATKPAVDPWQAFDQQCEKAATEFGRQVTLHREDLDAVDVPVALRASVLEIGAQLLRNAIEHGIEEPGDRVAVAKSPRGTVRLSFERVAEGYDLVVHDDGAGIDFERIRAEAVSSGRFSHDTASTLGPRELASLLFEPGFSTAREVTDATGRGSGLELVRRTAQRYGGRVTVSTSAGRYTLFRVHFPTAAGIGSVRAA